MYGLTISACLASGVESLSLDLWTLALPLKTLFNTAGLGDILARLLLSPVRGSLCEVRTMLLILPSLLAWLTRSVTTRASGAVPKPSLSAAEPLSGWLGKVDGTLWELVAGPMWSSSRLPWAKWGKLVDCFWWFLWNLALSFSRFCWASTFGRGLCLLSAVLSLWLEEEPTARRVLFPDSTRGLIMLFFMDSLFLGELGTVVLFSKLSSLCSAPAVTWTDLGPLWIRSPSSSPWLEECRTWGPLLLRVPGLDNRSAGSIVSSFLSLSRLPLTGGSGSTLLIVFMLPLTFLTEATRLLEVLLGLDGGRGILDCWTKL